jgi:hypothetical protein
VAAVVVAAASVSGAVALRGPAPHRSEVAVVDLAYVAQHLAALGPATDYVVKVHSSRPDGSALTWLDRATGDLRADTFAPDGSRVQSVSESGDPRTGSTVVWVDYAARTWFSFTRDPVPAAVVSPVPADDSVALGAYSDPSNLRAAVDKGWLTVIGQDSVNGAQTTHLRLSITSPKAVDIDVWLDDATYLPIRMVDGTPGYRDSMELSWMPRTAANLAELTLSAPAGFTRAPVPAGPKKIPPS